jgi:hypothetical protein
MHTSSHFPQWPGLVESSTHESSQFVFPVGHAVRQDFPAQTCDLRHGVLQAPQCEKSLERSKQRSAHFEKPELQATPHLPPAQVAEPFAVDGHVFPHPPQFRTSSAVFLHSAPHFKKSV